MFRIYVSIFLLLCLPYESRSRFADSLNEALLLTRNYFQRLESNYDDASPSRDVAEKINHDIDEFVASLKPVQQRQKRQSETRENRKNGVGVLRGFTVFHEHFSNDVTDMSMFVHYNGIQLQWFVATLDPSRVSLLVYNGNRFETIGSYSIVNGTKVIGDCSEFGCVLVVGQSSGRVTILRLRVESAPFVVPVPVQYLENVEKYEASRVSIWHGMNQMYLGIGTKNTVHVYHWLGEHFDSIQVIKDYAFEDFLTLNIGGSLYMVIVGERTVVLKFNLHSNLFVAVQRLPSGIEANSFAMRRGHRREHYLALINEDATIVYKFVQGRSFAPFQKIPRFDRIASVANKETMLLFGISDDLMKIYQYDGWKFVEIEATMSGVQEVYPISFEGEDVLVVRHANGSWSFEKFIWTRQKTWQLMREDIKSWCLDIIERTNEREAPIIPNSKGSVRLVRGYVSRINTKSVNGITTARLESLEDRLEESRSRSRNAKKFLSRSVSRENSRFASIRATTVLGNCSKGCRVRKLRSNADDRIFNELSTPEIDDQILRFENIRSDRIDSLYCPGPSLSLKNVEVRGTINGVTFHDIEDQVLRVSADQKVEGEHIYESLVASNGIVPLDIASRGTRQNLRVRSLRVKNLELTRGGLLLPLKGEPVRIDETLTVARARVTGPVHLRGGLRGKGVTELQPLIGIEKSLYLFGDYSVEKASVNERVSVRDLLFPEINESLSKIVNEAIRLDENVPVHLKLLSEKTLWRNIEANVTDDWIKVPSKYNSTEKRVINVTGTKSIHGDLVISKSSYETIPSFRIRGSLCAGEANLSRIETTSVAVDRVSVKYLRAKRILGAGGKELREVVEDTAISNEQLNLNSITLTGIVNVKNLTARSMEEVDFKGLLDAMVEWREPTLIRNLATTSNLSTKSIVITRGLTPPSIDRANNFLSKGKEIRFDALNGINLTEWSANVARSNELISLRNVQFDGGLTVNAIRATEPSVDPSRTKNMGIKWITANLKCGNLTIPSNFVHTPNNVPSNLRIKGSATFAKEPIVVHINSYNLENIAERVWLSNRPSLVRSRLFAIKRASFEGSVLISGSLNTKNYGPWNEVANRVLSRSKPQVINKRAYLRLATIPNIRGENATLAAPGHFLGHLINDTLKRKGFQRLPGDMRFRELIVTGDLNTEGDVNGRNFSIDVLRNDNEINYVSGKKTLSSFYVDNMNGGFNFSALVKNTLWKNQTDRVFEVTGSKSFANVEILKPTRVEGSIGNRRVENILLKSRPQEIKGRKIIRGKVIVPRIYVAGSVNEVDLKSLIERQLKKNAKLVRAKTAIEIKGNVTCTGDAEIVGFYRGVELNELNRLNSNLKLVSGRMENFQTFANAIDTTLSRKAFYWSKLELVEENSTTLPTSELELNYVNVEGLGNCTSNENSLTCDDQRIRVLVFLSKPYEILFSKIVQLAGVPLVVVATSYPNGGAWIYTYDQSTKSFQRITELHLPGASRASAVVFEDSLWLAVQLPSDTMILRYEPWARFEEYTLPGYRSFHMEISPSDELLVFGSDGIWRLGGLSGPRRLSRIPLIGQIRAYIDDDEYLIQVTNNDVSNLFKARFIGN